MPSNFANFKLHPQTAQFRIMKIRVRFLLGASALPALGAPHAVH